MLIEGEQPLADEPPARGEVAVEPQVMVVYRTRGIPWLLLPPLVIVSAVVSIVMYRRSERPEPQPIAVLMTPREPDTKAVSAVEPASRQAQTNEPAKPEPQPSPVPAAVVEAASPGRTSPDAVQSPLPNPGAVVAAVPPVGSSPDALRPPLPNPAEVPATVAIAPADRAEPPIEVPPPPPKRVDRIGFDPSVLLKSHEPPSAVESPATPGPTAPEVRGPITDDRPASAGGGSAPSTVAEASRSAPALLEKPRTEDVLARIDREAAVQGEGRRRLEAAKPELLRGDPDARQANRAELAALARRMEAERRGPFHAELRQILADKGILAGPEIRDMCDRYGRECPPEVIRPANRDLTGPASSLHTAARVQRMRRWGLPETYVLDDLVEKETFQLRSAGGPRSTNEVWVFAARRLLSMPPPPVPARDPGEPPSSTAKDAPSTR